MCYNNELIRVIIITIIIIVKGGAHERLLAFRFLEHLALFLEPEEAARAASASAAAHAATYSCRMMEAAS